MILKIKFILLFLSLGLFAKSQVYKAGTVFPYYSDINPDTLLFFGYGSIGNNHQTYNFNIDADPQPEFKIEAYSAGGMGGGTRWIKVIPTDTNCFVRFGRIDSLYDSQYLTWTTTPMAKPLSYGDSINSLSAIWSASGLSICDNSGTVSGAAHPADWVSTNDYYVGIKYQTASDTLYGWVRVNCPYLNQCRLKDYSMSSLTIGIKEYKYNTIPVFPNPATNLIQITDPENRFRNATVEILNYSGQTVLLQAHSNTIDVSKLPPGIYTLKISEAGYKEYYTKFIKE